ncbi:ATP-binding protein [Dactylosporangium fulvum]|uniref:ATP-binding protein n=1 Tax=Dactylosporangium fulvum TaxID=53359 RepID=A0ABY5VW12_9ACTN|nr:ATP-binding protein [Dactylosporangium fulvum]UWP81790.1 ATP-binding protein [Dactylosporangium fulvum]
MSRSDLIPRRATSAVVEALADTRVVLVNGARQSGKSTLVRSVAGDRAAEWRDLDLPQDRQSALEDPVGFVSFEGLIVIDEIQRAPELLLAIKADVDADPRPGRFLLTGSSRLLALRGLPDTLPGRMETIELWPFSQGEIDRTPDGFIDAAFRLGPTIRHESAVTRIDYAERVVRGGLPEAVARTDTRRRGRFLDSYVQNLIDREVTQLAEIERAPQLTTLIRLLAARSGLLVAAGSLESELQLSRPTIARYMRLLEEVFLIKRIPGWSRNLGTRATSTAKLVFVDSGIAARLLALDGHALRRPGAPFGPLLEGFVLSELARQTTWSQELVDIYHYRDHNKVEVDAVLENRQGQVIGIEIKAASTVRSEDFNGLRQLATKLDDDFVAGIVLYTGTTTLPFGPKLRAMPVSALWQLDQEGQPPQRAT